jgi:hypothetical protein
LNRAILDVLASVTLHAATAVQSVLSGKAAPPREAIPPLVSILQAFTNTLGAPA